VKLGLQEWEKSAQVPLNKGVRQRGRRSERNIGALEMKREWVRATFTENDSTEVPASLQLSIWYMFRMAGEVESGG
jgi:hypothetical protein